jgi:hypothetical protein
MPLAHLPRLHPSIIRAACERIVAAAGPDPRLDGSVPRQQTGRVHLTADDARELAQLRARAFGPGGHVLTATDLARLDDLESAIRALRFPDLAVRADTEGDAPPRPALRPDVVAVGPARRAARRGAMPVLLTAAICAIGGAVAASVTATAVAAPAAPGFPEFASVQTAADALPDIVLSAIVPAILPSSTRFIGRVDDIDLYLAQPRDYPGVCIVSRSDDADAALSVGCGGATGPGTGGLLRGVSGRLSVTVGDLAGPPPLGDRMALSDSVAVFRRVFPTPPAANPGR